MAAVAAYIMLRKKKMAEKAGGDKIFTTSSVRAHGDHKSATRSFADEVHKTYLAEKIGRMWRKRGKSPMSLLMHKVTVHSFHPFLWPHKDS